jgi:hypothetical protein
MPPWKTVYRAIVMIATAVILVQVWQLYGPSKEQVKVFTVAAFEKAQAMWRGSQAHTTNPPPTVDPQSAVPSAMADAGSADPPRIESAPRLVPLPNGTANAEMIANGTVPSAEEQPSAHTDEQAVSRLLTQLQELGAAEAQVVPWGSSGQLYRCCCRAKLAETSPLARHFEAVASEPAAAVEQVVAKVEGWRTQQQNPLPR